MSLTPSRMLVSDQLSPLGRKVIPPQTTKPDPINAFEKGIHLSAAVVLEASEAAKGAWIAWQGGGCPVEPGTKVEVRMRDPHHYHANLGIDFSVVENEQFWNNDGLDNDIVAYRLV